MPRAEQGVSNDRYSVIPRVLIFVFRGNDVLLLKGSPHKRIWPDRYNGIGGHIERGEDVLSAAKRELKEETGLCVDPLILCGTILIDTGESKGISIFVFKGDYQSGELATSEEGTLEWVPLSMLDNYDLIEDLLVILPRVLQADGSAPLFSARYSYNEKDQLCIDFG